MKYKVNLKELEELKEMGYKVHKFTPWHYRITKNYNDNMIDLFPTRKVYVYKTPDVWHKKKSYDNLLETIETILR